MKNTKLGILGIIMLGMLPISAQQMGVTGADTPERRLVMAELAEASAKTREQGDRIAAAADYLKLALVLGLGVIIGRMGAISHGELLELKAVVARLAKGKSQLNPTADP